MKNLRYIIFSALIYTGSYATGQTKESLAGLPAPAEYENIHAQKLYSDSLATGFVIWIKKEVKAHKHLKHTENIYVLEGSGIMKAGDKQYNIKAGDYIFIPMNTVHALQVTSESSVKVLSIQSPEFKGNDRVFVE